MNNRPMVLADPQYRKKVLRTLLLVAALGFLLLALLIPKLESLVNMEDPAKALATLKIALIALLIVPVLLTVYIIRIAVMTIRQRQYPPEGMQVLQDTPLLVEGEAFRRAIIMLILATLIIDACIFAAILALRLFATIL